MEGLNGNRPLSHYGKGPQALAFEDKRRPSDPVRHTEFAGVG